MGNQCGGTGCNLQCPEPLQELQFPEFHPAGAATEEEEALRGLNRDSLNQSRLPDHFFLLASDFKSLRAKRYQEKTPLLAHDDAMNAPFLYIKDMLLIPGWMKTHAMACHFNAKVSTPVTCKPMFICLSNANNASKTTGSAGNGVWTKDGDSDIVRFNLSSLPDTAHVLFFVMTMLASSPRDLNGVDGLFGKLVDLKTKQQLCCFEKVRDFRANTVVLALVTRDGPDWYIIAVNESFNIENIGECFNDQSFNNLSLVNSEFARRMLPHLKTFVSKEARDCIFAFGQADLPRLGRITSESIRSL
eukprot:gnl/TRDRNA2_/TRDRNA2_167997_c0_seq1.p1 gnl/TRDRNA2_/TRDRNA2_167997_c0~~gnl/TRDRNA2_/TRDRNA2_167997_c0_seq1.p1  ORF type:complete len:303 (-),score=33.86 gnl/TRDRNA2_/TRDRNA2_167997_c0_seq1:144-1052(-)